MTGNLPGWVKKLMEDISVAIEFKGMDSMEGYYTPADENEWGTGLIELAPGLLEIEEAGEHDGEGVYGILYDFDLLVAQQAFDEVTALRFGIENNGHPTLTFEGQVNGQEVVVIVYTEPFEDAEPSGKIDLLGGEGPRFQFYDEDEDDLDLEAPQAAGE